MSGLKGNVSCVCLRQPYEDGAAWSKHTKRDYVVVATVSLDELHGGLEFRTAILSPARTLTRKSKVRCRTVRASVYRIKKRPRNGKLEHATCERKACDIPGILCSRSQAYPCPCALSTISVKIRALTPRASRVSLASAERAGSLIHMSKQSAD